MLAYPSTCSSRSCPFPWPFEILLIVRTVTGESVPVRAYRSEPHLPSCNVSLFWLSHAGDQAGRSDACSTLSPGCRSAAISSKVRPSPSVPRDLWSCTDAQKRIRLHGSAGCLWQIAFLADPSCRVLRARQTSKIGISR